MKKVIFSLVAATALSSSLFAGKNVAPAPLPPLPVPEKPAPAPTAVPPLGLYVGGGLTYAKSKCSCDSSVKFSDGSNGTKHEATTYGVNLKAGYDLNEYIGIEGKYLYTPWGDKKETLKHYGLYVKPNMPVTDNIDAYALLGYGKTECETLSNSFKGFAWGLGTELSLGEKKGGLKEGWGVYAEYLRPVKKTGKQNITVNTVSAGVTYHF